MIDEEVERILREAEDTCRELLTENRKGLDLVARALLEYETIDGSEVTRLIQLAHGNTVTARMGSSLSLGTTPTIPRTPDLSGLPVPESSTSAGTFNPEDFPT